MTHYAALYSEISVWSDNILQWFSGFPSLVSIPDYFWSISRKCRNRLAHMLVGNGAKGQQKGKNSKSAGSTAPTNEWMDEQQFLESVRAAQPQAAQLRAQTTLLPSEWNVEVVHHQCLTARGGVSVVPRNALATVIERVGYTGHATAAVVVQPPDQLGLKAYVRDSIICSLLVPGLNGEVKTVQATRWLVQLGFGPKVEMVAEGTEVNMPLHMIKMVCRLSILRGWSPGFHPAAIFMEQISSHVQEAAVDQLIAREDGTCTFLCHDSCVEKLLKASGRNGTYFKVHKDDMAFSELDLLWLPETMSFEEGLAHATDARAFGLTEKGKSGRLALRFKNQEDCSAFAKEKGLPDFSHLGRFKITGVPVTAGLHGLAELLIQRKWQVEQIVFMDDTHAIFLAASRGLDDPLFWKSGSQPRQIRFKALNSIARTMAATAASAASAARSRTFPAVTPKQKQKQDFVRSLVPAFNADAEMTIPGQKRPSEGQTGVTPPPKELKAQEGQSSS